MKGIKRLIQDGNFESASEQLKIHLAGDPMDSDSRALYIELMCVAGDLVKADKQLDIMVRQHPDSLLGAINLRQLIRAAQARLDFYNGGATVSLFTQANKHVEALLAIRLALSSDDFDVAIRSAHMAEAERKETGCRLNESCINDIRDLDDSLGGFLEIFGTDGKFYVVEFSAIESLTLHEPTSLIEHVWRRVDIEVQGGPSGEAFLPMNYIASKTNQERLGKETNWDEAVPGVATGRGQKMLWTGEGVIPLTEIISLTALHITRQQCRGVTEDSNEEPVSHILAGTIA